MVGGGNLIDEVGDINFITRGTKVFGSVHVGNEICDFRPDWAGNEMVAKCKSESEYPPEDEPEDLEEDELKRSRLLATNPAQDPLNLGVGQFLRGSSPAHRGLVGDDGSVIDVMVVWTKRAECMTSDLDGDCSLTATTKNNMRGLIDLAVTETNMAYDLSGVATQLRLVHAYRDETYVEASSNEFDAALEAIKSTTDGIMDDDHDKRKTYGANMVAMIIDGSSFCGKTLIVDPPGYDSMFSVTKWSCATGYFTFGHEIAKP